MAKFLFCKMAAISKKFKIIVSKLHTTILKSYSKQYKMLNYLAQIFTEL